jgi:hypothetical protein
MPFAMDQNCRDRLVEWREREEKMSQVIREAWFYTGPMEAALGICKAPATSRCLPGSAT